MISELINDLLKRHIAQGHPELEVVLGAEVGTQLVAMREGRLVQAVSWFIVPGYSGFTYKGEDLPVPAGMIPSRAMPFTVFAFQERLEYAYVLKGSVVLGGEKQEENGPIWVKKLNTNKLADFSQRLRGEYSDRYREWLSTGGHAPRASFAYESDQGSISLEGAPQGGSAVEGNAVDIYADL